MCFGALKLQPAIKNKDLLKRDAWTLPLDSKHLCALISKELELPKNNTFREGKGISSFVGKEELFSQAFALTNYVAEKMEPKQ